MLQRPAIERIIPILKKGARRALRMRVKGFPKPYYCSFLLRDINWFNTWASAGSTYRRRDDRTRNVYCDLRVSGYRYDQTTHGGLTDNDEERESVAHVTAPIDDRVYDGLKFALWRLSESKFREALADYSQKEAARISTLDPNRKYFSFAKMRPSVSLTYNRSERIDEEKWARFCKVTSQWMSELPHVSASWVEFDVTQQTNIFVNTENSLIVQHKQLYMLCATLRKLTKEGSKIEQELVINCATNKELPDLRTFKKLVMQKYQRLLKLMRAKTIHSFSGPVLLYPGPAGLLFHEAIGHRLEGNRLLSVGEGQTFKGQIGKRILNIPLSMKDNPKLKVFNGKRCIGAYDFDDEGSPARSANLVEEGILKGFLTTRASISRRNFVSSGHARSKKYQRPISRMAVTIIEGQNVKTLPEMKALLIQEINEQKKPFGMIVYETSGGETDTTSYDFQAFAGDISLASLIYPDGKEVCVRGVDFVGTPLQALNNIIAVGKEKELDNSFCGAESGLIPVSTISPAILLSNLELQAKDEELVTQYILPRPK